MAVDGGTVTAAAAFAVVPYYTFAPMRRPDRFVFLNAGLAVSILVFAWPQLSAIAHGASNWYPLVNVVFTLLVIAIVVAWPKGDEASAQGRATLTPAAVVATLVAGAVVALALYRWMAMLMWRPYEADMLIVLREATRRLLNGRTPYATYRSYDAPWDMVMPYGPVLWGPFLAAQWLRLDLRFVTIIGELFVPVWCGVAAIVEAARGRIAGAASWLAVLAALVLAFDVQSFTAIGHTPAYWPLLPLFAVMVGRQRWTAAACLLGLLVVARTTMVAVIPLFLMTVWDRDRRQFLAALIVLPAVVVAAFVPFVVWDYRAMWDNMVLSYPRIIEQAVWPVLARPGLETIGVTEWLLEHHRASLVVPAQAIAMVAVYAAAWPAIRRGATALPWMALALFAFSMTSLYPVHYLYYDVLLLLVSCALAGALERGPARMTALPWLASVGALIAVTFVAARVMMSPFPHAASDETSRGDMLRGGFAMNERDGRRQFSWIVGREATIVLPRSSSASADIVVAAQSPFDADRPPQRVTAILNGTLLGEAPMPAGVQEIRFGAPRSTWWVGFNQLQLLFASTVSPRDVGAGDDPRPLALAFSRLDVTPKK